MTTQPAESLVVPPATHLRMRAQPASSARISTTRSGTTTPGIQLSTIRDVVRGRSPTPPRQQARTFQARRHRAQACRTHPPRQQARDVAIYVAQCAAVPHCGVKAATIKPATASSRRFSPSSRSEPALGFEVDDDVRHRQREAFPCVPDDNPARASSSAFRMRRDDQLVRRKRPHRIVDRLERIVIADLAARFKACEVQRRDDASSRSCAARRAASSSLAQCFIWPFKAGVTTRRDVRDPFAWRRIAFRSSHRQPSRSRSRGSGAPRGMLGRRDRNRVSRWPCVKNHQAMTDDSMRNTTTEPRVDRRADHDQREVADRQPDKPNAAASLLNGLRILRVY